MGYVIQCIDCGALDDGRGSNTCLGCGGLLEVVHDFSTLDAERLKRMFDDRLKERMGWEASGVWRYKELVHPELDERYIVTRGEGNTGLYLSLDNVSSTRYATGKQAMIGGSYSAIATFTGCREVWLKAQSENPSGSFKDNGMTVAISVVMSLGFKKFACSSTGNTSSSLAMYAAWCGAEAHVYIPKQDIAENKVLQTAAYGATIVPIEGTYDDGLQYLEREGARQGLYVCNSINPWRIEGQKTMTMEIAQTLGWQMPDWIVVPGGALSNVSSIGKALTEMKAIGLIDRLPRIALIRATSRPSVATALNIVDPPSKTKAERALGQFNGIMTFVSDEEILLAKTIIDRSGIGCEPASAASVAGLRKLIAEGVIHRDESAVCILTGHMLKDSGALRITNQTFFR